MLITGIPYAQRTIHDDSQNPYWPFDTLHQYNLGTSLSVPQILSNGIVKALAVQKYCPWIKEGDGFESVDDFRRKLDLLERRGGRWQSLKIHPHKDAPEWVPEAVEYQLKDTLEVLKDIVRDERLAPYTKWVPERLYDEEGRRVYADLWTCDWWWRVQVDTLCHLVD